MAVFQRGSVRNSAEAGDALHQESEPEGLWGLGSPTAVTVVAALGEGQPY